MSQYDDPFEPSQLDLSSEPMPWNDTAVPQSNRSSGYQRQQRIKLYFGCCKVFAHLTPPEHVLQGKADLWRAHCPRCGQLVEIRFE